MSEAIAFDTHRFVKRLTGGGFTEQQAETLAEEQVALLNANLATKADIARVEARMDAFRLETKAGMDALPLETKADFAGTAACMDTFRAPLVDFSRLELQFELFNSEIQKWMCVGLAVQGSVIVALIKLLEP